jgi:hypothetical protein
MSIPTPKSTCKQGEVPSALALEYRKREKNMEGKGERELDEEERDWDPAK